jgi:hypothetical protein
VEKESEDWEECKQAVKINVSYKMHCVLINKVVPEISGFSGLVVSMLASGTQDRGFAPGQSRWIFWAKKSSACLPLEGK